MKQGSLERNTNAVVPLKRCILIYTQQSATLEVNLILVISCDVRGIDFAMLIFIQCRPMLGFLILQERSWKHRLAMCIPACGHLGAHQQVRRFRFAVLTSAIWTPAPREAVLPRESVNAHRTLRHVPTASHRLLASKINLLIPGSRRSWCEPSTGLRSYLPFTISLW